MHRRSRTSPVAREVGFSQPVADVIANTPTADSSAWSRGPGFSGVCRVGDLTHDEANTYLTVKRGIDPDHASKIIKYFGSRILLLQEACKAVKDGKNLDGLFTSTSTGKC